MTTILKNHFEAFFEAFWSIMTNNSLLLMFHNIYNQSFNGNLNGFQFFTISKAGQWISFYITFCPYFQLYKLPPRGSWEDNLGGSGVDTQ